MERQLDADKVVGKLDASHKVKKLTLHEAVERRIARKGQTQGTTARMRWWVGLLGENKRLVDVTRDDIERGIVQLQKQGRHVGIRGQSPRIVDKAISASTLNRYITALSGVLQEHVNPIDGLPYNPARAIDKPRELQREAVILTPPQRERVLSAARAVESKHYDRMYFLVISAIATGARRGELLSLTWNQIDAEKGTAWLHAENTKTKRSRLLTWTGPALKELNRWAVLDSDRPNGWLFPMPTDLNRPLRNPQSVWERVCKLADTPAGFVFHDLRHLCATYLARNGANAFAIMEILGHTSTSTTQIYVNRASESHRELLEGIWSN